MGVDMYVYTYPPLYDPLPYMTLRAVQDPRKGVIIGGGMRTGVCVSLGA